MGTKSNGNSYPDPETFIPDHSGRIGIGTPDAMWSAVREAAGVPPPQPDPMRGSLTEGRDITAAFTELIREGKVCQYRLLRKATTSGAFREGGPAGSARRYWDAFRAEVDGLQRSFHADGGAKEYGGTVDRAVRTWTAVVPRLLTDEEASADMAKEREWGEVVERTPQTLLSSTAYSYRIHCQRSGIEDPENAALRQYRVQRFGLPDMSDAGLLNHFARNPLPRWYRNGSTADQIPVEGPSAEGLPAGTKVIQTVAQVTTEERNRRWIEDFTAEVELCIERFRDTEELPHELGRLIAELKAFEVCAGEGRVLVEHLRSTGVGLDVLRKVADGKARLLLRLEEIAKEYADDTPHTIGQGQRLKWQGNTSELCELIHLLAENNWIEVPKSRSKLADRVHAVFQGTDGEPLDLASLRQYLKKTAHRPLRHGVSFEVSERPSVN